MGIAVSDREAVRVAGRARGVDVAGKALLELVGSIIKGCARIGRMLRAMLGVDELDLQT